MSFTDYYNDLALSKNNLSYWYPRIKNCGIKVPVTQVFKVPEEMVKAFYLEGDKRPQQYYLDVIYRWIRDEIYPALTIKGLLFMKNGAFSNKFNFSDCIPLNNPLSIAACLVDLEYTSLMFGTGGNTELVFRERIVNHDSPTIYNGMPLQPEFRVFYDFDNHKALYIVNYWDWNYCFDSISRNKTDAIIYSNHYPSIERIYNANKDNVMKTVEDAMKDNNDFTGIWSIDILQDETGEFWLIDMAEGYCSAYWDIEKAGITNENS